MSARAAYDPETEGLVYHVTPVYQTESVSEITSESESAESGVTVQSEELSEYFITHHGRQHPASQNVLRWMPSDNTRRDILRHVVEKYIFGNNYLGPVGEILRSNPAEGPLQVLEVGTRSGTWIQEMAAEFPHVQFRSVDVVPLVAHAPRSNIIFDVYDISQGLDVDSNTQDIVFINSCVELTVNYQGLLIEAHRVLRPGGLIHIREFGLGLWDRNNLSRPAVATNPNGCRVFDLMCTAIQKSGADPFASRKIDRWLSPDAELWSPFKQPRGFENIFPILRTIPLFPHAGYPCAAQISPQMIPWITHFHAVCARDSVPMLCDSGLPLEEAEALVEAMIQEMPDPARCPLIKWYAAYATKRAAP